MQRTGTQSAKRKLKKISGRERRFKKDTNHVISKQIVSKAKGTTREIALEDLKGIRSRATVRHEHRDRHSKWAFGELTILSRIQGEKRRSSCRHSWTQETLQENAQSATAWIKEIDRQEILSGVSDAVWRLMADYVAARNIASRARFNEPIVAPLFSAVTISLPSGGRS